MWEIFQIDCFIIGFLAKCFRTLKKTITNYKMYMNITALFTKHQVLPLTGQSESVGKRRLQLASYQSLEHLEQILSRPPEDEEINTAEHQWSPNQIHAKCHGSIWIFKIKIHSHYQ